MTDRGTDYEALVAAMRVENDGIPARPIGDWTLRKRAFLAYYLPAFADAQ